MGTNTRITSLGCGYNSGMDGLESVLYEAMTCRATQPALYNFIVTHMCVNTEVFRLLIQDPIQLFCMYTDEARVPCIFDAYIA